MFLLIAGCSGGGGSDSEPTQPPTQKLVIYSPNGLSLFYGEELKLSVSGGTPLYQWSLRSSGDQTWTQIDDNRTAPDGSVIYVTASDYLWGIGPTVEVVITVTDSIGNWGTITVQVTDMFPSVIPAKATVPLDVASATTMRFTASGGTPPYYWVLDKPYLAQGVPDSEGDTLILQPVASGNLKITLFDAKNLASSATLQIVSGTPKIVPNKVTLSLGESITLRASNGTPPYYDWYLTDPSVGTLDPPSGGWGDLSQAVFTARRIGNTEVYLDDDLGERAYATVTVIQNQTMLTPSEANIAPGEELILTAKYGLTPYYFFNGDQNVGELTELSYNQVLFEAKDAGITVIRVEDSRGQEDTCTIMVSNAFQIYPLSLKGSPGEVVKFFLYGGQTPYDVLVNDVSVGSAVIKNGNEVHFTIAASQNPEDTAYPDVVEVYDADGLRATAEVVVAGVGCELHAEPSTAVGNPGDEVEFLVLCGTGDSYSVTTMDATLVETPIQQPTGNLVTVTIKSNAVPGLYPEVIRIADEENNVIYAGIEVVEKLAVTPSSASGAPNEELQFVVSGGKAPYTAQLSSNTSATASVSGSVITLKIANSPTSNSLSMIVQDAAGQIVSVPVTITNPTCTFELSPSSQTGTAGNTLAYQAVCGTSPYLATILDFTAIDSSVDAISITGNLVTVKISGTAAPGTYSNAFVITDANAQSAFGSIVVQ